MRPKSSAFAKLPAGLNGTGPHFQMGGGLKINLFFWRVSPSFCTCTAIQHTMATPDHPFGGRLFAAFFLPARAVIISCGHARSNQL
jgi:hypothetical protein